MKDNIIKFKAIEFKHKIGNVYLDGEEGTPYLLAQVGIAEDGTCGVVKLISLVSGNRLSDWVVSVKSAYNLSDKEWSALTGYRDLKLVGELG